MPFGCIIPIAFPDATITSLKSGTPLTVSAAQLTAQEPATFNISLTGFTAATNRIEQLARRV
ncbi:hypothetical protein FY150_24735 (plasmid) [Agrobacterium tumefaciens]|nr:hypothetical protein FY150_24735 [Agrobacterium tumefaciens]